MPKKREKKSAAFRVLRLLVLSVLASILIICLLLLWLNQFGLPQFIQRKVATTLYQQGVAFEARQIKLAGFKKLVLLDSRISGTGRSAPEVTAPAIEIDVSLLNALRGIVDLQQVHVRKGTIYLLSAETAVKEPVLANAEAFFSLNEFGHLKIHQAEGNLFGLVVRSTGTLFNARDIFMGAKPPTPEALRVNWQETIQKINSALRKVQSPQPPLLSFIFKADARRPEFFEADLKFHAEQAQSPWGRLRQANVSFAVHPSTNAPALVSTGSLEIEGLASAWASLHHGRYNVAMNWPLNTNSLFSGEGHLNITNLITPWTSIPQCEMTFLSRQSTETNLFETTVNTSAQAFEFASTKIASGGMVLTLSHEDPLQLGIGFGELSLAKNVAGHWKLDMTNLTRTEFNAGLLQASGTLSNSPAQWDTSAWGPWRVIADWVAQFEAVFIDLESKEVVLGNLNCSGSWKAPLLEITEAKAELYGGSAGFNATLNVAAPALSAKFNSLYDYHQTAPILDKPAQAWLGQISWETPPALSGEVAFNLPDWTNSWENLREIVLDSIDLKGQVQGQGAFREIPVDSFRTDFLFSDYIWRLPNLEIHRPEGHLSADYQANDRTLDFTLYINSHIDPQAILPILDPELQEGLKMVRFPTPPEIEGQLAGNLRKPETLAFDGKVRAQNFLIKKEPFLDFEGLVSYTNLIIEVKDVLAHRVPSEEVRAPELRIDITNKEMHVRDAISTMNPHIGMKLIGPVVYNAIEPYQFGIPPLVRVNGVVPLSEPPDAADLHFDVIGKEFSYWRFRIPEVTGHVHWKDDDLSITNVHSSSFYQGELHWNGQFHFNNDDTADFSFQSDVRGADARLLLADIVKGTNKMEGTVDGTLNITSANSENWKSWNGYGKATLRDGFLWDMPVFGLFTPMLEAIAPGLGVSRVTSGFASFRITNSVVATKDLQVRAPAFRLRYEGEVDFDGNINARMEALLLRDTWFVGKVISATLWPLSKVFEANITGTLEEPKSSLRHVPAFITAPLKPVFNLRDLFRGSRRQKPTPPP